VKEMHNLGLVQNGWSVRAALGTIDPRCNLDVSPLFCKALLLKGQIFVLASF